MAERNGENSEACAAETATRKAQMNADNRVAICMTVLDVEQLRARNVVVSRFVKVWPVAIPNSCSLGIGLVYLLSDDLQNVGDVRWNR